MKAPRIVAHRGDACEHPENSRAGFIAASQSGAEEIEFDLHLSADGELIVIHDPTLDETTFAKGEVVARSAAELASVRLRGGDDTVLSLEQLLDAVSGSPLDFRIELKKDARRNEYAGLREALMETLTARKLLQRSIISSFDLGVLRPFAVEGFRTAVWYSKTYRPDADIFPEQLKKMQDSGVVDIAVLSRELDEQKLEMLRKEQFRIGAWTINGPSRLNYWLRMPVDYVVTDQPALAVRIRNEIAGDR